MSANSTNGSQIPLLMERTIEPRKLKKLKKKKRRLEKKRRIKRKNPGLTLKYLGGRWKRKKFNWRKRPKRTRRKQRMTTLK